MLSSDTIAKIATPVTAGAVSAGYSYTVDKVGGMASVKDGLVMGGSVFSVSYVLELLPLPSFIKNLQYQVLEGLFGSLIYASISMLIQKMSGKGSISFIKDTLYSFGVILASALLSDSTASLLRSAVGARSPSVPAAVRAAKPKANLSKVV